VPENDFFATVDELHSRDFIYDRKYFSIERSDDLVVIQLTVSNTRTVEQKKALYRRIVERLGKSPGCGRKTFFSTSWKSRRRTGRSATARRNTLSTGQQSGGRKGKTRKELSRISLGVSHVVLCAN
jgi:hypothetical protein